MKYVFLQDLFSNFLLAMLVLAVIAMRTQSDVPPQPSPSLTCPVMMTSADEIDQVSGVVIVVSKVEKEGLQLDRVEEKQAFFDKQNSLIKQEWELSFISNGCILSRHYCGANVDKSVRKTHDIFDKCKLKS